MIGIIEYKQINKQTDQQIEMLRGKVIRFGVALHCIKHNFNRNKTMVIHHGLMGSSKNFRSISKNAGISNYVNSHLIDCRNHGESPHTSTHTITDLADDLMEYIDTHKLIGSNQKLILMGHSMGAMALMEFTKKYNQIQIQSCIDSIILIDIPACSLNSKPTFKSTGQMLSRMNNIDLNKTSSQIFKQIDQYAISPDIAGLLKSDIIPINETSHRWRVNLPLLVTSYQEIGNYSLQQNNSKKWKQPVHLIYGDKSPYVQPQDIHIFKSVYSQMTQHHFYPVQGAGHWVHFDQTKLFIAIIKSILQDNQQPE